MTEHFAKPIILASGSPRRQQLLAGLGLQFKVQLSDIDEELAEEYSPNQIVEFLARRKVEAVKKNVNQGLVIGSDTIVVLEDDILGKPRDEQEAFDMLSRLQGNRHVVFSGLAIVDVEENKWKVAHQSTKVTMGSLTPEEIKNYIRTKEPMDKAGAYAIQGIGATLIEKIEGDYFTVVGLPLRLTAQFLREFGVDILNL